MIPPILTILTPTYNGMPFLRQAIESVAAHTSDGRVEHVVADGGSTDGTVEFLSESSVRWVSQPDRGQSDALNTALAMATGEWIGWLNCDEFYLEGVLDRVLCLIGENVSDLIYGDYIEVTPQNEVLRLVTQHSMHATVLEHFGLILPSCTAFVRRSAIEAAGGWNVESKTMMDWELWLHILRAGGRFSYTGKAHAGFTRHEMQASARLAELVAVENVLLNSKFAIHTTNRTRRYARALRVTKKVANGGYLRELAFQVDLRRRGRFATTELPVEDTSEARLLSRRFKRFVLS